ncbi:MAG: PP2C family protein-serine/threonine phosphatase [Nocardioides sp.]
MIGPTSTPDGFHDALLEDDPVQLYERAPCGYLSTTPDGLIVKVNETFLAWTGLEHRDLVGRRTFAELLTAGGRIYHETHYAPMLSMHGSAREIALDIVKADGGRLPVLVNSVLERDAAGAPTVVRVAIFDASDRREYERELLRAKERAEESEARARALAMTLQRTLIPPEPPEVSGLDVAAVYRPAGSGEEVGGDFYDVFQIGADDWVVVLGDVCGKGVDAAVVTALVRYTLRAITVQVDGASAALRSLNDVLLRHRAERFCTVVLLRVRRNDGVWVVSLSSAGHPLPLLVRPDWAPVQVGEPGSLLGVLETVAIHDTEIRLEPGSALLLYTDGVTEGRRGPVFYEQDRLLRLVGGHQGDAAALTALVIEDVLSFQDGTPRDDVAVVVVRVPDAPAD